ncbi:hypothetical protein JW766_04385 [Candidatus Dojkabacteria bacterium]|nr:hypothetical protein [Candidatus Dojkabacteria bacterium]
MNKSKIVQKCRKLLNAYKGGKLGQKEMPEDAHPSFKNVPLHLRIAFFSLPMALNYQRNSYKLWEAAAKTFLDASAKDIFEVESAAEMPEHKLRSKLLKHKLALQPKKHTVTWKRISETIFSNWGNFTELFKAVDYDFLKLKSIVQRKYKKDFPYLSGPKIFHYWSFIIDQYGGIQLYNKKFIEIAPDTHVLQASKVLGVISDQEMGKITREEVSKRWRMILRGSGIDPIDMHSPLWFWSRNGFKYNLQTKIFD